MKFATKFRTRSWVFLGATLLLCQVPSFTHGVQAQNLQRFFAQDELNGGIETVGDEAPEVAQGDGADPTNPEEQRSPVEVEMDRLDAIELYNAGVDKLSAGDYVGAIADFTAAIEIDNTDADSYYNRGYSHHVLGQFQAAYEDYGEAVAIRPNFADAYGNRCYAAYLLGEYELALQNCDEAIALKDDNPDFFINRGNAYDDLAVIAKEADNAAQAAEYHALAIADYDAAIALKPDHAKAYYNRALAYNRMGDDAAAAQDYSASIKHNTQFAEAYFNRAITYYNLGQTDQAIADLREAARIFGQQNQTANQNQALDILSEIQANP